VDEGWIPRGCEAKYNQYKKRIKEIDEANKVLIPYSESLTRKLRDLVASLPQDFHLGRAVKDMTEQGLMAGDVGEEALGQGHSGDDCERSEHRQEGLR
jgi:hypothetical protein